VRVSRLGPAAAAARQRKKKKTRARATLAGGGRMGGMSSFVGREKKKKNYSIPLSSSQLPKEEGGTYKSSYFPQQLSSLIRAAHNISKQSRLSVLLRRRFRSLAKGIFRSLSSSSSSS
jgi:hypothetical protein